MATLNRNSWNTSYWAVQTTHAGFPSHVFGRTSSMIRRVPHKASRKLPLAVVRLHPRIVYCCACCAPFLSSLTCLVCHGVQCLAFTTFVVAVKQPPAPTYHAAAVLDSAFRAFNGAIMETKSCKLPVKRGTRFSI